MKRTIIAVMLALALVLIPVGTAFAAKQAQVTVTARPGLISIASVPDSWDAGTVGEGDEVDTLAEASRYVDNLSRVAIDITIICNGWTGDPTNDWAYGAPATDTAWLRFSTDGGTNWTVIPDSAPAATFVTNLPALTDQDYDLQLQAPTEITFDDLQTSTITLTASRHT